MKPRVRIAPSPTGLLHIGTVRTALFNYLFARKHGGTFIVRVEDTDQERSTKESEKNILSGLNNLGLIADEGPENPGEYGPYRQSERKDIYKPYLQQLLDEEKAYYCFCTSDELNIARDEARKNKIPFRYSGKCRDLNKDIVNQKLEAGEKSVIRLKIENNKDIQFTDIIRGETSQNTKDLTGDMVIAKSLDYSLYNFVVVIDDHLMDITHVIRGEDHTSNTPKQILVYEAFGWEPPQFAHLPLILNSDRSKLSKRKNSVSVDDYLDDGYLKEGLVNFLALLGWNDGTEKEIYSLKELEELFTLDRVNKAGAIFDLERLNFINGQYIKNMDNEELAKKVHDMLLKHAHISKAFEENPGYKFLSPFTGEEFTLEDLSLWCSYEKMRVKKISEFMTSFDYYLKNDLSYEPELLIGKKMTKSGVLFALEEVLPVLEGITEFTQENLKTTLVEKIKEWGLKNGEVLWPMRAALTGKERSPGAFEIAVALGKVKTLERIENAIEKMKSK